MKRVLPILATMLLTACGPMAFTPQAYPIRGGLIAPFDLKGKVEISNGQPSEEKTTVYSYGGSELFTTLKAITEVMVRQTQEEVAKGSRPSLSDAGKSMELKVASLLSEYSFFHWNSSMTFSVKLGNDKTIRKTVKHTSGVLAQDLNGCIAEGVMGLLADPDVKAYLAE